MSYIGENVAVADFSKQTFTANSSTTVFTLSSSVANSSCLIVSVGGVIQEPDVAYTASGTTLTFSVAPTTGNDVYVIYIGKELPKTTHGDNTITNALIPDGIITSDKIQSLAPSKLTGALPAIDGSALTGVSVNTDSLEDNIALLGFKLAANNALAKYNLVDRTIDEYQDGTGIDASASTNEVVGGTGTGKYYSGSTNVNPFTATGGTTSAYTYNNVSYKLHTFTSTSNLVISSFDGGQTMDVLVIAGGGGGGAGLHGQSNGAGAGAGGLRWFTGQTPVVGTFVATVGLGGTAPTAAAGTNGGNSSFIGTGISISGTGGAGGNRGGSVAARSGGSGAGANRIGYNDGQTIPGGSGNTGGYTPVEGYAGGGTQTQSGSGGGGGAGGIGGTNTNAGTPGSGGFGGPGVDNFLNQNSSPFSIPETKAFLDSANLGEVSGSSRYITGGGGGAWADNTTQNTNEGGLGGGGNGGLGGSIVPTAGLVNTGSGGGGGYHQGNYAGGVGGSGVVIVRTQNSSSVSSDLTLQSTANTASTAPTKGDITMLIEDAAGTAVLNTDIKAYVSRDGGTGWDQGTLTHEGTWGTNKKVISFHDTTFSNSASGTDMRYKITTHNQSVSKETRIHATSLAWS